MGLTHLVLEVGNPGNHDTPEQVEVLIDSGAVHSVVPAPVLEKLGISPLAADEFRLAGG